MEAAGLRTAPIRTVLTAEGAISAAAQAGYPVVLKGAGPTLLHKTEAQAVYTGLSGDESVLRALHALRRRPDVTQVIVQRQITGGVEMFAGALLDPQFGHLVMCGSGGTRLELLRDTSCRLAPLTARGAADMIEDVRGKALLRGFRGSAPVNEAAYRDALLRLSALLQLCPEIEKVDLNPVIVTADAAWVVDARVRIAAGGPS